MECVWSWECSARSCFAPGLMCLICYGYINCCDLYITCAWPLSSSISPFVSEWCIGPMRRSYWAVTGVLKSSQSKRRLTKPEHHHHCAAGAHHVWLKPKLQATEKSNIFNFHWPRLERDVQTSTIRRAVKSRRGRMFFPTQRIIREASRKLCSHWNTQDCLFNETCFQGGKTRNIFRRPAETQLLPWRIVFGEQ